MRCPKCNASAGNLVLTSATVSCRVCGSFHYLDQRGIPKKPHTPMLMCSGCNKPTKGKLSKKGFCPVCQSKLTAWTRTDQSTPPPFEKVFGIWVKNKI